LQKSSSKIASLIRERGRKEKGKKKKEKEKEKRKKKKEKRKKKKKKEKRKTKKEKRKKKKEKRKKKKEKTQARTSAIKEKSFQTSCTKTQLPKDTKVQRHKSTGTASNFLVTSPKNGAKTQQPSVEKHALKRCCSPRGNKTRSEILHTKVSRSTDSVKLPRNTPKNGAMTQQPNAENNTP
jgi:hypothetical protein